jgi:hypothetical protein
MLDAEEVALWDCVWEISHTLRVIHLVTLAPRLFLILVRADQHLVRSLMKMADMTRQGIHHLILLAPHADEVVCTLGERERSETLIIVSVTLKVPHCLAHGAFVTHKNVILTLPTLRDFHTGVRIPEIRMLH